MKKVLMLIAAIGLMYSCGGNNPKNQDEKASVEDFSDIAKNVPSDAHNAKNSLDYKGTYKGKIPAADAEGILVSLKLEDSTYVKTMEYIGKSGPFEEKGKYTWNKDGNIIVLSGEGNHGEQYFVGENTLSQLDMDGNKITGDHADMYILKK